MLEKIKEFLSDLYEWLLWCAGAALYDYELDELKETGGDRLTYWFRRSRGRLGNWWAVAVAATIIIANIRLITFIKNKQWGWFTGIIAFDGLCVWLIPHIFGCW